VGHQIPSGTRPTALPTADTTRRRCASRRREAREGRGAHAGPRRPRHLVLLGALAILHLGWPDPRRSWATTSHDDARHRPRHHLLLGGSNGHDERGDPRQEPYSHVYIHGTILDRKGKRMSKSLRNGIDPVAMICGGVDENTSIEYEPHGADGVRFSLTTLSTEGQDLKLWPERFEDGQRSSRSSGTPAASPSATWRGETRASPRRCRPGPQDRGRVDPRAPGRRREGDDRVPRGLPVLRGRGRVRAFVWDDFCDWYVEAIKARFGPDSDPEDARRCRRVLAHVLDASLRLLHPICPFITRRSGTSSGNECATDRSADDRGGRDAGDDGKGGDGQVPDSIMVLPGPPRTTTPSTPRRPGPSPPSRRWSGASGRSARRGTSRRTSPRRSSWHVRLPGGPGPRFGDGPGPLPRKVEKVGFGTPGQHPPRSAVEVGPGSRWRCPPGFGRHQGARRPGEEEGRSRVLHPEGGGQAREAGLRRACAPAVVDAARKRVAESREQLRALERGCRTCEGGKGWEWAGAARAVN